MNKDPLKRTPTFSIVIVDDNLVFRNVLRKVFKQYRQINSIQAAQNADELFEIIEANNIDIVTMDISLPGIDGFEATRELRRRRSSIKVIVVSIYDTLEYRALAKEAGAIAYIVKKNLVEELDGVLETVFRERNEV